MKKIIILAFVIIFVSAPLWADDPSFCDDKSTWEYFESMVKEYPDDVPLQILHGLKIGLCAKIAQNTISEEEAIRLFNDVVDQVAELRGLEKGNGEKKEL